MIDPRAAFGRIVEQDALGPRYVGSPGHRRAQDLLGTWLACADRMREHAFEERFFGRLVAACNIWARFHGEQPGRMLLGTHYDTRPWADRDPDEKLRKDPVPGANDGGSGTALLAELALELCQRRERPTIDIVLFDAEDWHGIDGKEVSLGARRFVADLPPDERPDRVVVLDMIGGRNLMLDVDANCQLHPPSLQLTRQLFELGRGLGLPAFQLAKEHPVKWIGCDHSPFQAAGIPTAILIDIDYAPWHTVGDVPSECDEASLAQIGRLVEELVFTTGGEETRVVAG
jgi:Zn-dependent M28 family amino/carboxypeptidase